ncbi:hypothetical protein [Caulobacter sp. 17J65-9]|uniref:hypothetical protein n=1 Tax=Caulobacter sp. 17J65-9 TaxID=2709382 RepID=UPI0013CB1AE9|nr:hypothetical protein [Caulobacter sp. 17J65-9]NEX92082.1 hypothetical protein [Caulobacter sp. 17J65-9]
MNKRLWMAGIGAVVVAGGLGAVVMARQPRVAPLEVEGVCFRQGGDYTYQRNDMIDFALVAVMKDEKPVALVYVGNHPDVSGADEELLDTNDAGRFERPGLHELRGDRKGEYLGVPRTGDTSLFHVMPAPDVRARDVAGKWVRFCR